MLLTIGDDYNITDDRVRYIFTNRYYKAITYHCIRVTTTSDTAKNITGKPQYFTSSERPRRNYCVPFFTLKAAFPDRCGSRCIIINNASRVKC